MGTVRIYFDCETNGFHPPKYQVVEVGVVAIHESKEIARFASLVYASPEAIEIGKDAFKVNGIKPEDLATAPEASSVAASLQSWLQALLAIYPDATYHAFNNAFDFRKFLCAEPWNLDVARIGECVMKAAKEAMGLSKFPNLGEAAAHFSLKFEGEAHRALADTLMAAGIFEEIIRARKAVSV